MVIKEGRTILLMKIVILPNIDPFKQRLFHRPIPLCPCSPDPFNKRIPIINMVDILIFYFALLLITII